MRKWNLSFKIVCVYTSIILGAGFASGQEITAFFLQYGTNGFWGFIFSGLLFALCGCAVFDICRVKNIHTFKEFSVFIGGKNLGFILELIVAVFLFAIYTTMLSATGAVVDQTMEFSFSTGVILMGAICFCVLCFGIDGIIAVNSFLAPIMIIGGFGIGLYSIISHYVPVFMSVETTITRNWLVSSILYASYNIITAVSILISMSKMTDKKSAKWGSILSGICISGLGLCIAITLHLDKTNAILTEIPMLNITKQHGRLIEYFYILILLAAIFTTAVGSAFALIDWIRSKLPTENIFVKLMLTMAAMIIAHIGFSVFVGKIYPIFGFFGLIELVLIYIAWARCRFQSSPSNKKL